MINHVGKILEYDQIICAVGKLHKSSSAASLTQQIHRATVATKL